MDIVFKMVMVLDNKIHSDGRSDQKFNNCAVKTGEDTSESLVNNIYLYDSRFISYIAG